MATKMKRSDDDKVHPMWLTDDEDERRQAIIRRAAQGARKALRENAPPIH